MLKTSLSKGRGLMKKWSVITIVVAITSFITIIYIVGLQSKPAITYFPLDKNFAFTTAETDIQLFTEKGIDDYEIIWKASSATEIPVYLRQDVSLLFDNGRLRGALSKWVQDTDTIHLKRMLTLEDSSLYEAISFHHGEIHEKDSQIKSMQQMSSDHLYVIDSPAAKLDSFKTPSTTYEKEWKTLLDRASMKQLTYHWDTLYEYFDINKESYTAVPLTDLNKFAAQPIAGLTQAQTDKVMGQLWEGLYKNYLLPIVNAEKAVNSYIPIILFDKKNKHLLVLFEMNGKKEKLIQQYSFSE